VSLIINLLLGIDEILALGVDRILHHYKLWITSKKGIIYYRIKYW
jgi:hypothetical protein